MSLYHHTDIISSSNLCLNFQASACSERARKCIRPQASAPMHRLISGSSICIPHRHRCRGLGAVILTANTRSHSPNRTTKDPVVTQHPHDSRTPFPSLQWKRPRLLMQAQQRPPRIIGPNSGHQALTRLHAMAWPSACAPDTQAMQKPSAAAIPHTCTAFRGLG